MIKNKKSRRWVKITVWIVLTLLLLIGGLLTAGYFYYGRLIRSYLTETISSHSKGVYKAGIGEIYFNLLNGNLRVRNLVLTPDLKRYNELVGTDSLSPLIFGLKIDKIRVRDFEIKRFLKERVIDIGSIRISSPEVIIHKMIVDSNHRAKNSGDKRLEISLPQGLGGLFVGEIFLEDGKLTFNDHTSDSLKTYAIPSCSIRITGIKVSPGIHSARLFNADDINLVLHGFEFRPPNGMNLLSFGEIGLSTGTREVWIKSFRLKPNYSRHDYSRKLGYQSDRMDIQIGELHLFQVDMKSMLLKGSLIAGKLRIANLQLDDYRDKRVTARPGFKPPMPQDGIRKLKSYLKIDTVLLDGGKATYSEQVGEEPGTLFFDKLNATFLGLTNDSVLLQSGLISKLHGSAWLQGKAKLDAELNFRLGDKKNFFTFSARMGTIDLREINPMLSKLVPGHVRSGQIRQMIIPEVKANDDVAVGSLLLYYKDLSVLMDQQKEDTWSKIKTGVINFVANDLVVNNNNPTASGKMHKGIIYFARNKEKGIFNYLWKSTFSGIKSTIGINDKNQKQIKKAQKAKKK